MKRVLFSPIGGTDPISNDRDGAMLHICRKYKPDYVYLYLSKEMIEFHQRDNRYLYCLEQLGKKLDHHFEVELIERNDMKEVQIFDSFINEYRDILNYIVKKHPECEYYLNVSSGTPAMKSSLQMLSLLMDHKMIPIQVSTPVKKINPHLEDHEEYEVELYWEFNEDNDSSLYEDRCIESKGNNLLDQIKKQIIINHIYSYDYVAAMIVAETLVNPLSENVLSYLRAANWRLQLNIYGIQTELKERKSDILPVRNEKYRNIFEHILNLQIKLRKEEYVDFVRGLTPVIMDIFQIAVEQCEHLNYKDYISKNRYGVDCWDRDKVYKNPRLRQALERFFKDHAKYKEMYSSNLAPVLEEFSDNQEIAVLSKEIRSIESKVRNLPAHEIISVTKDWITRHADGNTPEQILEKLKRYTMLLNIGIKKEYWNSYDDMNALVVDMIKRE